MRFIIIVLLALFSEVSFSQYKGVPVTKGESQRGILRHYQVIEEYASVHLYLYKDKRFRWESFTCRSNNYSEGTYQQTEKELMFTSDLQKGSLPVLIEYRKRDSLDKNIKRIAFVKDLEDNEIGGAIIYVNDDSTQCIDGDYFCTKEPVSIDSIKVVLENGGPSSAWIKVKNIEEIIQLKIQTKGDLSKYMIYNGRFRRNGKTLEALNEE